MQVIDRKLGVQEESQLVQTDTERTKALDAPIVKASEQGFRMQSANDDYRIKFGGVIQGNGRFFTSGDDKIVAALLYQLGAPDHQRSGRKVLGIPDHAGLGEWRRSDGLIWCPDGLVGCNPSGCVIMYC